MMKAQKIDLNALMFSPNFDEDPEISAYIEEKSFRLSFWNAWWGIFLGAAILFALIYPLFVSKGFGYFGNHCTGSATQPNQRSR